VFIKHHYTSRLFSIKMVARSNNNEMAASSNNVGGAVITSSSSFQHTNTNSTRRDQQQQRRRQQQQHQKQPVEGGSHSEELIDCEQFPLIEVAPGKVVSTSKSTAGLSPSTSVPVHHTKPLPVELLGELQSLQLYYPGHQRDYYAAQEAFDTNSIEKFHKALKKLKEKQQVYDQYRSFTRLNELAALELVYPGHEEDLQNLEQWHLSHPPSDENDALFKDKLEGLRNKDALFFGDRSHPNIVALDGLVLTYPNWESDFQDATKVHCDQPAHQFPDKLHMLREKQRIHVGDRCHWRLQVLDKLQLTYPGWKNDLAQVEIWHLHHADTPQNTSLFAEVIEGMRDQQIIYLGWDGVEQDADDDDDQDDNGASNNSESNRSSSRVAELLGSTESRKKTAARAAVASSNDFKTKPRTSSRSSASSSSSLASSTSSKSSTNDRSSDSDTNAELRTGPPLPSQHPPYSSSLPYQSDRDASINGFPATAAAAATATTNPSWLLSSPSSEGPSSTKKKPASLGKCIVCLSRSKTHVFVPCGHLCCCAACGTHAMETGALCPICRSDANNVYRVFY
jgi:Zinc finger, C3HC4 type (RING finger)